MAFACHLINYFFLPFIYAFSIILSNFLFALHTDSSFLLIIHFIVILSNYNFFHVWACWQLLAKGEKNVMRLYIVFYVSVVVIYAVQFHFTLHCTNVRIFSRCGDMKHAFLVKIYMHIFYIVYAWTIKIMNSFVTAMFCNIFLTQSHFLMISRWYISNVWKV